MKLQRLLTTAVGVALTASMLATGAAAADDTAGSSGAASGAHPTASGQQLRPGQAYMGWNDKNSGYQAPTRSATTQAVAATTASVVYGIDVSSWQGNVDWNYWWNQGMRFAYVKATEGTSYTNSYFAQQYNGSYNRGYIRGSYHFALPNKSSGATQADYFISHGGGWSRDGKTLPGALDIEFNPYGSTCYGLSQSAMRSWIASFTSRYKYRTGRDAVIYTNRNWWIQCTGDTGQFGSTNPLWIANYSTSTPPLPAGWSYYTFFQYTSSPLDKNKFNGAYDRLQALANG